MSAPELHVPEQEAIQHIDWNFLAHLRSLEKAIDPRLLDGDIMGQLKINEDKINFELEQQPSKLFQFSAIAIRMTKILALYEATVLKQYQAHVHGYATLFLKATGGKDTIDGKKEAAITIFGKSVPSEQKLTYAELCLRGEKLNFMTTTRLEKYIEEDTGRWLAEVEMMMGRAYPAGLAPYEDVIVQHEEMKEKKELADSLAKSFEKRGIAVSSIASNIRSSGGEADGMRLRGSQPWNAFLVQKLRTAMQNNPNATDDMLAQMVSAFQ